MHRERHEALHLNPASTEAPETKKLYDGCRASGGACRTAGPSWGRRRDRGLDERARAPPCSINKLSYGGTPLAPRRISAGALDVEITKLGYKPVHLNIEALAGIVNDVVVDLEATP